MDYRDFKKYCKEKNISYQMRVAFLHYLEAKYEGKIPHNINFESEYRQFLSEATSKL